MRERGRGRKASKQALRNLNRELAGTRDDRLLRRLSIASDRRFEFTVELRNVLRRQSQSANAHRPARAEALLEAGLDRGHFQDGQGGHRLAKVRPDGGLAADQVLVDAVAF